MWAMLTNFDVGVGEAPWKRVEQARPDFTLRL